MKITLFLLATLGAAWPLHAQRSDSLSLGNPSIVGNAVEIPVFINDVSGTPLGMDQPPNLRIGAYSFMIHFSNGEHVESATAVRSGITADLTPLSETSLRGFQGAVSYIASFDSDPVFRLDSVPPGDLVVTLRFVFREGTSAELIQSTTYEFDGSPARTQLSNRAGTTSETRVNGRLALSSASFHLSPARLDLEAGHTGFLTLSAPLSTTPVTITLESSHPQVIAVPASVTLSAGEIQIPITPLAIGGPVTITARLGTRSVETIVTVRPSPIAFVDSNLDVVIATSRSFTVSLFAPRSTPTTILLDISDSAAAALPATLTIPSGELRVTGQLRGLVVGRTFDVTATAVGEPGYPASARGTVLSLTAFDPSRPAGTVSAGLPAPKIPVGMGSTVAVPFRLDTELEIPVLVTLTSSDPSRLVVQNSLTVPAGQRTAFYEVQGVSLGSVTVSASLPAELGGLTVSQLFEVTAAAAIPTLGAWSLIALAAVLGLIGVFAARVQ